ncbi:hypothetical protein K4K48_013387 [Colletotrichum sp. SAR 10_66]|nr:hypothetical protein K4K48_013387 [Colletotrichum sp. SAR 10_66]
MNAQKPFWKAIFHGLLHMLTTAVLANTCQAHVQGHHHKRVDRSSFQAFQSAPINQVFSLHPPGLGRREMQTIVLTTTISTYIEIGIPCDATEVPQSMSSLLTRPPPLSIPTSLGTIATGVISLTAPDGGSPAPPQPSALSSTSAAENPKPSSSNSLSSSQTSSTSTTGIQSSTIDRTSTSDSSSAPAVPDTSTAASRSTTEPSKPATATSTTIIPSSTNSVALSASSSTRNITTVVVSSTIVVLWPETESTPSVADSTTSASSKNKHTAWVTQTSQETVTEWMQPSSSSSSSSSTSSSSLPSFSSNSARTAWVTKTAKATVTEWFDPPAVSPSSSSSTSTTPDGPAVVVVTASAQATITRFHDSTQTIIVSPPSSAPASPEVHPRLPTDSNLPGPTKRIVRFSQRIWYTENKHQIMVIATYEDNHVVTVYTAPERTDLPAVLVLDDQNGNKRGSLKMTFRMGFFTIDFRSEMAGRVAEWENHWTKNEADEDAPWCETVYLKDDGKERLAREIWCYYTA